MGPTFVRLLEWIVPVGDRPRDALWWRGRMLAAALVVSAVLGALVIVPNLIVAGRGRQYGVFVVDALAYSWVMGLLFARRLSFRYRALGLLAATYSMGMYFTGRFGVVAAGPLWLLATPVLAAVFLGTRAAVGAISLLIASYAFLGVLIRAGRLHWLQLLPNIDPVATDLLSWVVVSTNSVLIAVVAASSAALISDGLDREIAARRVAEDERFQLTRAVEQSHEGMMLIDPTGQIERRNQSAQTLFPVLQAREVGMEMLDLFAQPCDGGPPARGIPWRDALRGEVWSGRCVTGPDATRVLDATVTPVRDDEGTPTHALLVLRDVTREQGLEDRLRQSAKLEAVGTLVGGIAHDFNNLLQPILANAELLKQQRSLDADQRRLVDDILTGAERGRNLVRRVLTFTRGATVDRQPLRLVDVVDETARLLTRSLPTSVRVSLEADPALWVLADPAELHHAFVNLATNAAHAMPGGGALAIRAAPIKVTEGDRMLASVFPTGSTVAHLSVEDTGTGMHARTLARIFEPFFTTKPPGQGTGLGLASVHGTVTDLGGIVVPESAVGVGTTMHLYLPTIDASALALAPSPAVGAEAVAPLQERRVLVVDDERVVLESMVRILERAGCRVTRCDDPRTAVARVEAAAEPFDCVLTDLTMPHVDGIELARQLAAVAPGLPVVLVSGFIDDADQAHADEVGIRVILPKPYSRAQLLAAIETAIGGDAPSRRTPRSVPVVPAT